MSTVNATSTAPVLAAEPAAVVIDALVPQEEELPARASGTVVYHWVVLPDGTEVLVGTSTT